MAHLVERKVLAGTEVEENLLQEPLFLSLPLTAIWRMSRARVVSLEQVIKRWAFVVCYLYDLRSRKHYNFSQITSQKTSHYLLRV